MSILLGLSPFIVFFVLMRLGLPGARASAGFAPSVPLEVGRLARLGVLLLCPRIAAPEWTVATVRLAVDGGLLVIVLVSLAIGMPFTLPYSRESVPKGFWTSP